MELDRRISNKLLVSGIFAVLIFGLVGSQQAMAGNGGDIDIDKCVAFIESEAGNRGCIINEASARSIITLEEGDTGFFRIEAKPVNESSAVSNIIVQDKLPAGLQFVKTIVVGGNSYNPSTGVWDVGTISEGNPRTLIIEFEVLPGTCGSNLVNTASLTSANEDTNEKNDSDSATVSVAPGEERGCGPIVEVHCEFIHHQYDTTGVGFGPGFTIVSGSGERFEILNGGGNKCTYTYANGFSEEKKCCYLRFV